MHEHEIVSLLGPAPCDTCEYAGKCRQALLSCEAFEMFVRGSGRWNSAARLPDRPLNPEKVALKKRHARKHMPAPVAIKLDGSHLIRNSAVRP
jgi:hypothetical protein